MATFRSVAAYKKAMNNRAKALKRAANKSSMEAAKMQVKQAKQFAPRKTRETRNGIKKRKLKNGAWVAESIVSGKGATGFMQNMWANQTEPHMAPEMHWPRFGKHPQPVIYGKNHRTTGLPAFWDRAVFLTRQEFIRFAKKNTRKALRAGL